MHDIRSKLESASTEVRRIVQPYRPTLNGPTAVRKIFRRQNDALSFAQNFGAEMMVFSYESSSLGHEGQRLFLACGVQSFFHHYRQMDPALRCHYEVIPTYRSAKLYLDLEFYKEYNVNKDGQLAVNTFVKALCAALDHFYDVQVNPDDILILDASTERKFSQHVIFNSPHTIFETNLEQGQLIRLVCEAIERVACRESVAGSVQSCGCSDCFQAAQSLAERIFAVIGPAEALQCMVNTSDSYMRTSLCDTGVYTRNRNFRLAGSRKLKGKSVLSPSQCSKTEPFDAVWPYWECWAVTLVTWSQHTNPKLLQRPVRNCQCSHTSCAHNLSESSAASCTDKCDSAIRCITSNSIPSEACEFVEQIVINWYARGKNIDFNVTECCPPIHRWRIHRLDSHLILVTVNGLRFCERVGRQHRSNHVILIFDFGQGSYYQKCLDPDCRKTDFRSESLPIPVRLCEIVQKGSESQPAEELEKFENSSLTDDDLVLCGILDSVGMCFTDPF